MVFSLVRAETYNGSPSLYFCDFTNTAICYKCLSDAAQGRQFCKIMGYKYYHECIRERGKKGTEEEVFSALGVLQNINEASIFERYSSLYEE